MPSANKLALIVGVDIYNDVETLDPLPSCKKDAEDLYILLSKLGYAIQGNAPLIGSRMDRTEAWVQIREAIGNFFLDARPSQTLLFYFSGHGIPKADEVYLATPQIDSKKPSIKGLSLSELANNMNSSKSNQVVCIIDACYSGAAELPGSKGAKNDAMTASATYDKIWKRIPKAEGKYLLLSSQAYERSWAIENNSIYTKYLIGGLNGVKFEIDDNGREIPYSGSVIRSSGYVTPESLHNYVYYKVASQIEQTPKLRVNRSSEIVLAYYPNLANQEPKLEHLFKLLHDSKIEEFNNIRKGTPISPDFYGSNLSGLNLQGADLHEAELSNANLVKSDLRGVDFRSTNFHKANLTGAKLSDANLTKANLQEANFTGAVLRWAKLTDAILNGAKLTDAILNGAILANRDLRNTNFQGADLSGSDLSKANLSKANLSKANLSKANLSGADLHKANLSYATLYNANLSKANLSGADLTYTKVFDSNLSGADLSKAKLDQTNLHDTNLTHANLADADILGNDIISVDFSYANLSRAWLTGEIRSSNFSHADLSHTNLRFAKIFSANFSYADLSGANFDDATLHSVNLSHTILYDVNLDPSIEKSVLIDLKFNENTKIRHGSFFSDSVTDNKDFFNYLSKKGARTLPLHVESRQDMVEKLSKLGYDDTSINDIISQSTFVK